MFKLSAETKFNIQHFEIFFLFFSEIKNLFFGGAISTCHRNAELHVAQRVKKVKVH